ncbi:hypothetical protein AP1H75_02290 [Apilactobacillus apinorum]
MLYFKYSDVFWLFILIDRCFRIEWFAQIVKQIIAIVNRIHIVPKKIAYRYFPDIIQIRGAERFKASTNTTYIEINAKKILVRINEIIMYKMPA